jgi:nitrate/TMAO reductase-like tetraheme cytochrome c subunit
VSRAARIAAAATLLVLFGGALLMLQEADSGSAHGAAAQVDLSTSDSCRPCHQEVWDEWSTSWHAQSFTDPLVLAKEQSNNFRNEQCLPCHAPSPIFETGLGKERAIERVSLRELGVDCLACHRSHDRVVGPSGASAGAATAACAPAPTEALASPALCAPCHNQHNTVDEWEASSYAKAGVTCLDCHMQPVTRLRPDGTTKHGRSHRFPGGHDLATLQRAGMVEHSIETAEDGGRQLKVKVTNSGAGHNYPADARHRALDLVVTLLQRDSVAVPPRESGRGYGRERGTARRRFRNPYREETERLTNLARYGRENTQITAGETVEFVVPFDPAVVTGARIELIYKLTPIQLDDEGVRVHDATVELH